MKVSTKLKNKLKLFCFTVLFVFIITYPFFYQHTDDIERENPHTITKETVKLYTEEGMRLLSPQAEFIQLKEHYVLQYTMHCGAASAVCVLNTLIPGADFTQNNLFSAETASIITQDVVFEEGFTIEELSALIKILSGLKVSFFHAGWEENEYHYTDFLNHLKINRDNPYSKVIVNYSRESVAGTGTNRGHFSPVADYNQSKNMVLLLEVGGISQSYWIDAHDLFSAMNTIDTSCNMPRGWIIIEK